MVWAGILKLLGYKCPVSHIGPGFRYSSQLELGPMFYWSGIVTIKKIYVFPLNHPIAIFSSMVLAKHYKLSSLIADPLCSRLLRPVVWIVRIPCLALRHPGLVPHGPVVLQDRPAHHDLQNQLTLCHRVHDLPRLLHVCAGSGTSHCF